MSMTQVNLFARNATWSGVSAGVRAVTGLMISLLAVRLLGGMKYGQLVTVLSLFVFYLSLNSSFFTVFVTRLMAVPISERLEKNDNAFSAATFLAMISVIFLGILTMFLWLVVPDILSDTHNTERFISEIRYAVLVMGLLTAFQIMSAMHAAFIEGVGRLDIAMKCQVAGAISVVSVLFILFVLGVQIGVLEYIIVIAGGACVDLCLLVFVKCKLLPAVPFLNFSRESAVQMIVLIRSGTTLQAASLMTLFLEPMNKFFLNYFVGPLGVTAYDLAMKVVWGIQSLFSAAMRVFLHMAGEQGQVVDRAYNKVLSFIMVPTLAAHVLAGVFLTWVAHHWVVLGNNMHFMLFFGIATISNLGMVYIAPLYISLIGRGDLYFILRSQIIVAVLNVIMSFSLIPLLGVVGSAFGLLGATVYNVIAIFLRHKQKVGENKEIFSVLKKISVRYTFTGLLFIFTIVTGGLGLMNIPLQTVIVVSTFIILKYEPVSLMLLDKMRFR